MFWTIFAGIARDHLGGELSAITKKYSVVLKSRIKTHELPIFCRHPPLEELATSASKRSVADQIGARVVNPLSNSPSLFTPRSD